MNIRSFTLTNKAGAIWNLNSLNSFMTDVEGLGFEHDFDFETVGNGILFLETKDELKQPKPEGTIMFSGYDQYNAFVRFCQSTPLKLTYTMPDVDDSYFINLKIEKITKKELESGCLQCNIKFIALGNFYKSISASNEANTVGKVYNYTYPYTYSNNASGTVTINSDTNLDSPVKITILGPCVNPSWTHYVNGEVNATGKVNCSVAENNRLVIDTTKIPYSIKTFDAYMNELTDEYENSDFSTQRFINIKLGENKIGFTHESVNDLNITVEGWLAYESV